MSTTSTAITATVATTSPAMWMLMKPTTTLISGTWQALLHHGIMDLHLEINNIGRIKMLMPAVVRDDE
ncbi:hypothetical protein TB1_034145 [Malus domestica]